MSLRPGPSCSATTEVVFLWMLCMCVGVYDQFYSGKLSAFVAVTLLVGFYHHRPPPSPPQLFLKHAVKISLLSKVHVEGLEIMAPGITS